MGDRLQGNTWNSILFGDAEATVKAVAQAPAWLKLTALSGLISGNIRLVRCS